MEKKKKPKSSRKMGEDTGKGDADYSFKTDLFSPEDFITANEKVSILSLDLLKQIYDLTKSREQNTSLDNPLSLETEVLKAPLTTKTKQKKRRRGMLSKAEAPVASLITGEFDEDQIWEELELQNSFMYDNLVSSVSKLLAYKNKSMEQSDSDSDVLSASEEEDETLKCHKIQDEGEDSDSDFFESDAKSKKKQKQKSQLKKSIVDDKFFSLAQMTEHIEQVEAEMERAETGKSRLNNNDPNEQSSSSEDESIDLFDEIPSDTDGEKEEPKKYFYKDFFDPPPFPEDDGNEESSEQELKENGEEEERPNKKVTFSFGDDEEGDEEEDSDSVIGEEKEDNEFLNSSTKLETEVEKLSTFEKRRRKIEENIEEIENNALQPKSWHLMGESTGETRPENALLEEHLIYDHLIRPAPEITVQTTLKLEDIIKQRIKDGAWDDVERKVRPVEDPREYKKRLVLDGEKSKASLAEIYEKEYIEQKEAEHEGSKDEKEPEEHIQIKKEMRSLFQKLDALSHFHFTPKTPTPEVKIVSSMPSITVEETAAASISDANMLAPQEIAGNAKGVVKGYEERTATDKKRDRRKKKKQQHLKRLAQEEKARMKGLALRNIKLADGIVKSHKTEKLQSGGYSTSQQTGKELKSSKAFFAKLQESATSHIDKIAKRKQTKNVSNFNNPSAKRFKM